MHASSHVVSGAVDARGISERTRLLAPPAVHPDVDAFAYPASETESLWDVSIDTLESHRRRGYGSAAVVALAAEQARRGKRAVWGAADSNPGSLALARSLGFAEAGRLWVASRRTDE